MESVQNAIAIWLTQTRTGDLNEVGQLHRTGILFNESVMMGNYQKNLYFTQKIFGVSVKKKPK